MAAISIDGTPMTALPSDADQINYDNTSSGMAATQVQDAIDELALEKKDEYATITYAQWQAMTPAQQAAKDYYISDYPSSQISAGNVSYNNSSSGMSANNVQSAVDELKSSLTGKQNRDFTLVGTIDVNGTINLSGYKEVYFTPQQNYVSPIIPVINGASCMYYVDDTNYIRISIDTSMVATLLCNSSWADNCGVYAR